MESRAASMVVKRMAEQRFELLGCGRLPFLANSGHGGRIAEPGPWKNSLCLRLALLRARARKYLLERAETMGRTWPAT